MSINSIVIAGNVTADPKLVTDKVLAFTLAVNDYDSREGREVPSFIDCKVLGDRASRIVGYISKGKPLVVQGRIKQESWETPEGQKRSKLVVIASEVKLPPRDAASEPTPAPDGDDIPF